MMAAVSEEEVNIGDEMWSQLWVKARQTADESEKALRAAGCSVCLLPTVRCLGYLRGGAHLAPNSPPK